LPIGLNTGVWTSKIITQIIEQEFGIGIPSRPCAKTLKGDRFFCTKADIQSSSMLKKRRRTNGYATRYPNLKKTPKQKGAIIVYGDEASFRQSPTLHQTWAPVNAQPKILSKGQRNSQKIFGAVELYFRKFPVQTQRGKLQTLKHISSSLNRCRITITRKGHRIYLIQDNASYHKKPENLLTGSLQIENI